MALDIFWLFLDLGTQMKRGILATKELTVNVISHTRQCIRLL